MKSYNIHILRPFSPSWLTLLSTSLALGAVASAQINNEANRQIDESETDQIVELSPFVVEASGDVGYLASSSLGGTRLNTRLRDIPAAVSVITPELLRDTASNNLEDILVYAVGAEVGGPGGNFSGMEQRTAEASGFFQSRLSAFGAPNRSRGLAAFDMARDYFLTSIPFEAYNTERVDISRGPNSILFGLGSPAGIVNNGLKSAMFRDANEISVQVSELGSHRETFDFNKEIIKGQLAVRVVGLNKERNFQQDPAFAEEQRLYGALKFQRDFAPNGGFLSTTTVRANFETGRITSNPPYMAPPIDEISNWFRLGKPTWNVLEDTWSPRPAGKSNAVYDVLRPGVFRNPTAVFPDASSSTPNAGFANVAAGARNFVADQLLTPSGVLRSTVVMGVATRLGASLSNSGNPLGRFTASPSLRDPNVFDFFNHKLTGGYDREVGDLDAYNVTLEQLFFEDRSLGVELAYDSQRWHTRSRQLLGDESAILQVDMNSVMMNGDPNPNYGRIFFPSQPGNGSARNERQAERATAFYRLDLSEKVDGVLGRLLGRHVFSAMYNRQQIDSWSASGNTYTTGPDFSPSYMGNATNYLGIGTRLMTSVHYIGPSILGAASLADVTGVKGLSAIQLPDENLKTYAWNRDTKTFDLRQFSIIKNSDDGALLSNSGIDVSRNVITSTAFTWQSFLFGENLVGTLGWRNDEVEIYSGSDNFDPTFTSTPLQRRNPTTNLIIRENYFLPNRPGFTTEENLFSWGVVAHSPDFINRHLPWGTDFSVHYNSSGSFQPTAQRYDSLLNKLGNVTGNTEEYGFTVSALDGKLVARVNRYKTTQEDVSIGIPTATHVMFTDVSSVSFNTPEAIAAAGGYPMPSQKYLDFYNYTVASTPNVYGGFDVTTAPRGTVTETTDYVARGTELELAFNALPNWRILVNAAHQKSVRSNSGEAILTLIQERLPIWGDGVGSDAPGEVLYANGAHTQFIRGRAEDSVLDQVRGFVLQDGGPARELREWRWSLLSTYEFTRDSVLSGWRIGGALRWLDKPVIGYPVEFSADANDYVPSVANPYYGDATTSVDAWIGYRFKTARKLDVDIQLNGRNILSNKKLIPALANPDGSVAGYSIADTAAMDLTVTFRF